MHMSGSFSSVTNLAGHFPKELEIISMANDKGSPLFMRGKQGDKQLYGNGSARFKSVH